jgi:PAS domain S-box-containing protein
LEQNEFCVWVVFDPLDEREARKELERAWPGAKQRLAAGDIEIVPQSQWAPEDGAPNIQQLARDWEAKFEKALARGYAGMRVNANAMRLMGSLGAREDEFGRLVGNRRMILLCAYPLAIDHAADIFGGPCIHRLAVARRHGDWQVVETPELSQARADVKRLNAELEGRATARTEELAAADKDKRHEAALRRRAEESLRVNRERSQCYLDLGLVGMATVSPAIGCMEVNPRMCEILGYEQGELMQIPWAVLVHPDDLADDIGNYERIVAGEVEGFQMPKRWIRKNGDVVHTNVSVQCQRRLDGSVDFLAAMVEEVAPFAGGGPPDVRRGHPDHKALSGRERAVVRLIGMGRSVKEIAAELALSEKTVSTYRGRVLTKLKLRTTAQLIRYAVTHRLAH